MIEEEVTHPPAQKMFTARVKTEVTVVKDDLGDAITEAGKKTAGAGSMIAGVGCVYKAIQERNLGLGIAGVFLEGLGIWLVTS